MFLALLYALNRALEFIEFLPSYRRRGWLLPLITRQLLVRRRLSLLVVGDGRRRCWHAGLRNGHRRWRLERLLRVALPASLWATSLAGCSICWHRVTRRTRPRLATTARRRTAIWSAGATATPGCQSTEDAEQNRQYPHPDCSLQTTGWALPQPFYRQSVTARQTFLHEMIEISAIDMKFRKCPVGQLGSVLYASDPSSHFHRCH